VGTRPKLLGYYLVNPIYLPKVKGKLNASQLENAHWRTKPSRQGGRAISF
jgi:hypothetical protein